jgi:hypothetical protein
MGPLPLALSLVLVAAAEQPPADRIDLALDASQAEAVLALAERRAAGGEVADADWERLFATEPYLRLEQREAAMGREFSRADFRAYVASPGLATQLPALRRTLDAWKGADLSAAAARALPYLPASARIRARVYPVIKPRKNSFVFEAESNPAIFLSLDPAQAESAFANTVAHELHHIGLASLDSSYEKRIEALPAGARQAARWMGAFGEGLAVLAAAGSSGVHPLQDFPPEDRWLWDLDQEQFDRLLAQMDAFLLDVAQGGFTRPEVADRVAFTFFGYRGPWYTVGWRMAVEIERRHGRATLVECMADPRRLLARYNQAARQANAAGGPTKLPLWRAELLAAVQAPER